MPHDLPWWAAVPCRYCQYQISRKGGAAPSPAELLELIGGSGTDQLQVSGGCWLRKQRGGLGCHSWLSHRTEMLLSSPQHSVRHIREHPLACTLLPAVQDCIAGGRGTGGEGGCHIVAELGGGDVCRAGRKDPHPAACRAGKAPPACLGRWCSVVRVDGCHHLTHHCSPSASSLRPGACRSCRASWMERWRWRAAARWMRVCLCMIG